MRDWFDYASPSGLDNIFENGWRNNEDDAWYDEGLIKLDFSGCDDKFIDKEGNICELL